MIINSDEFVTVCVFTLEESVDGLFNRDLDVQEYHSILIYVISIRFEKTSNIPTDLPSLLRLCCLTAACKLDVSSSTNGYNRHMISGSTELSVLRRDLGSDPEKVLRSEI